ncbi:N(2)-fixation sustaining protein CowN [Cereibacter sphaeroides]|uniref:N(2)-fixation sustaining protein CowN n=1 Tax=Cereibacter sphaeroides TaxID=1063 RepID=UPI001F3E98C8|nr:N(2)-fixation sustaining protein CowN [Cereibacter sphaeroides]MCE6960718.1 N(2)-fixation sustaining protein CowN [Cereibacter sphaeroides]MCE6970016.1 N(2)-fixation sustaining protein CowN [Cereibacter sphaeroides]MCE6974404.1 N(2)-fixation sustaining protein CowN [Cereibacter sphaeroides]
MNDQTPDRYVTFLGLDCDAKADRMMDMLTARMQDSDSRWVGYFRQKLAEKERMATDNLHFVGSQINSLYSFFEELEDGPALDLLWHLEHNCC